MQKAFFNDRYQQTDAVIEGRKTMARQIMAGIDFPVNMVMGRVLPDKDGKIYAVANGENIIVKLRYKVGEVVAQCYYNAFSSRCDIPVYGADRTPGWLNKLFVRADLMPHQIRITGISCERLQDISDADCMKEGGGAWSLRRMECRCIIISTLNDGGRYGLTLPAKPSPRLSTRCPAVEHGIGTRGWWFTNSNW